MTIVLTDREADVMQVLWDHGPSVVADVRRRLPDKLAYTTVLTVLRVLESKGYVGHEEEGRVHRYFAAVQQNAPAQMRTVPVREATELAERDLLRALLSGDPLLSGRVLAGVRPDEFLTDRGQALANSVYSILDREPSANVASASFMSL